MPHREQGIGKRQEAVAKSRFALRGRIWVDGPEGTFLGWGRVTLLERIREYGSITKAAKSMGMSYRHAWELMESMNRQAPRPFIKTASGGKGGGGTELTPEGEEAIRLFRDMAEDFHRYLDEKTNEMKSNAAVKGRRRNK